MTKISASSLIEGAISADSLINDAATKVTITKAELSSLGFAAMDKLTFDLSNVGSVLLQVAVNDMESIASTAQLTPVKTAVVKFAEMIYGLSSDGTIATKEENETGSVTGSWYSDYYENKEGVNKDSKIYTEEAKGNLTETEIKSSYFVNNNKIKIIIFINFFT